MAISNGTNELLHDDFRLGLCQPLPLLDIIEKLAAHTTIHDIDHNLVHHEGTKVRNDVLMLELLDRLLLGVNRVDVRGISIGLRVHELDRYFLACLLVHPQHHQSESAFT